MEPIADERQNGSEAANTNTSTVQLLENTDCCCNDMSKLNSAHAFILFVSYLDCAPIRY